MTGYQKLKKENEFLWKTVEKLIKATYSDHDAENIDDLVTKEIAWLKWKFENETNQEKN